MAAQVSDSQTHALLTKLDADLKAANSWLSQLVKLSSDLTLAIAGQTAILEKILFALNPTARTAVSSRIGEIDMAQTLLKSLPGSDVLTFTTMDSQTPPNDITASCTYTAESDSPAVAFGPVTGNTVPATYTPGTATLTIKTTSTTGDATPDVVLAATIIQPITGATTVTAQNPNTVIS